MANMTRFDVTGHCNCAAITGRIVEDDGEDD
jgi:hypothetical protein